MKHPVSRKGLGECAASGYLKKAGGRARPRWGGALIAAACLAGVLAGGAPAQAATPQPGTAAAAQAGHAGAAIAPGILAAEKTASSKARATHAKVVVDVETTETSQVTANPDGTFTLTESSTPVRVLKGGAWVPVSTALGWEANGTVAPAATATGVVFSGGGSRAMATLAQGSDQLSFTFPEPLPRPTLSGDTAIYSDVLPSVDLRLTADATGFSEILVIKDRAAAASPALAKLTLGLRAQGVQVKSLPDGTAEAVSSSGKSVFHSDQALMWDSTGTPAPGDSTPATSTPATSGSRALVTAAAAGGPGAGAHRARVGVVTSGTSESLAPDQTLLTASDTTYPVYEDPTWSGNRS